MYSQSDSDLITKNTVEIICAIYNTDLLKTYFMVQPKVTGTWQAEASFHPTT